MQKKIPLNALLWAIALLPFGYWLFLHLNQDAWWDEILSFKNYALVEVKTTLTSYPDPNNHIFFNLLNGMYARLLGTADLYEALDQLPLYRALQAVFALGCLLYVYLLGRQLTNPAYAVFGVLLLTCTLPFLNFSLQLRGYNLSGFFLAGSLYHGWKYLDTHKQAHLAALFAGIFLLLYTLPSNIYPLAVFLLFLCWEGYTKFKKSPRKEKKKARRYLIWLLAALGTGFLLVYLAYLPVLENVLNNRFVTKEPPTKTFAISTLLPKVLTYFVSNRWGLLLFVGIGFIAGKRKKTWAGLSFRARVLLYVLFGTFLLVFLHGKAPFERTLVCLAPVFALSLSTLVYKAAEVIEIKRVGKKAIALILSLYSLGTCLFEIEQNDQKLIQNLVLEKREQNLYRNYYLSSKFTPDAVAKKISQTRKLKNPVIMADEIDRVSVLYYLLKYNIESYGVAKVRHKKQKVGGQDYNYVAMVQKTNGRDQDVHYINMPCRLPANTGMKEYLVLLSLYQQKHPGQGFLLLTAYAHRLEDNRKLFQGYTFLKHEEESYLSVFEGSRT